MCVRRWQMVGLWRLIIEIVWAIPRRRIAVCVGRFGHRFVYRIISRGSSMVRSIQPLLQHLADSLEGEFSLQAPQFSVEVSKLPVSEQRI
jgi:hypothetical protein